MTLRIRIVGYELYRLVEEDQRAWHAGRSYWRGDTDLNTRSIGIEIVNRSACDAIDPVSAMQDPEAFCEFREYDGEQIDLLIDLVLDIMRRHPSIDPINILAHSDVAPDRKLDPGPTFPWRKLYERGIGAWYDEDTVQNYRKHFEARPVDILLLQKALAAYGYDVDESGELDTRMRLALMAFQLHFRPSNWSGQPDAETAATLFALLEKYRPLILGCVNTTVTKCDCDLRQIPERYERDIELVVARRHATVLLHQTEHAFHFIASSVFFLVVLPLLFSIRFRRHARFHVETLRKCTRLVVLVGLVHRQCFDLRPLALEQLPTDRRVVAIARRQRQAQRQALVRRHGVNLGRHAAARSTDGLLAVFLSAPAPCLCTFTDVLSRPPTCAVDGAMPRACNPL